MAKGRKEMMFSVNKVYDMYLLMLLTLDEVRGYAEFRIEENRKKQLPSQEDLNPNTRFIDNRVFNALTHSNALLRAREKSKVSWVNEREMFKKLFEAIRDSDHYKNYMASSPTMEDDRDFAIAVFKEFIANSELISNYFEEHSIYWQDDLDQVCVAVIRTIKGLKEGGQIELLPLFKDEKEDLDFVKKLFEKTVLQGEENVGFIMDKTKNWELDRIASMDMLLMQMAITEARHFSEIPIKVTLNEYIEISKFYSTPRSNGFINGVLDKVFFDLKEGGQIKKLGRGLIG